MVGLFIFIIGLTIGSFLNVCIYRIAKEESIIYPPSHCTSCGYKLKPQDLIPIMSYLLLGGKCRSCKSKISLRYPLIELLNGIMYLLIYFKFHFTFDFFKFCIFASLMIVIAFIDFDSGYVFKSTVLFGVIVGVVSLLVQYIITGKIPVDFIFASIIGWIVIFLIVFTTKGMGEGDIDIALLCGLFLGVKLTVLTLFIAFVSGGIVGAIILLLGIKDKKAEIAFGPYLVLGALSAMLFGNEIIRFYIEIFM